MPFRILPHLLAIASIAGCGKGEDRQVRDASRLLTESLAFTATSSANPAPSPEGQDEFILYVDGSQSMAGYVGCQVDPTSFDEVMDRISVDLGITQLHRFGTGRGSREVLTPSPINVSVHCPEFYDRAQNPDAELFQLVLADTTSRVHLYLTDGVQSDLTATQSPSVNVLRQFLLEGRPLAILAFRSRFSGRGWSEARQSWAGRWEVENRPFYMYIFAPTEALLDRTLSRLSAEVRGQAQTMRFGDASLRCTPAPAAIPRQAVSERGTPWLLISPSITNRLAQNPAAIMELACAVRDDSPLASFRLAADSIKYGRWTGSDFAFPVDPPTGTAFSGDSVAIDNGGFRSYLHARIAADPSTRFGYYALQVVPRAIEMRPDIAGLSTPTDADPESADRTYRFGWVVEQLLRTQVERSLPRSQFSFTATYR